MRERGPVAEEGSVEGRWSTRLVVLLVFGSGEGSGSGAADEVVVVVVDCLGCEPRNIHIRRAVSWSELRWFRSVVVGRGRRRNGDG